MTEELTHISLFTGIGGIDLAAEWAGFTTILMVENNAYCQKVLKKHWPDVSIIGDVKEVNGYSYKGITLLSGGFPCQDISQAKTVNMEGFDGARTGLWSEFRRLVSEIRPRYVLVENVSALLFRGIGRVLGDLSKMGYNAEWQVIPAYLSAAPHRRNRTWIVAYTDCDRLLFTKPLRRIEEATWGKETIWGDYWNEVRAGFTGYETIQSLEEATRVSYARPWLRRVSNGLPETLDRLRCLGNAVVPQQIYPILKAIADIELLPIP